MSVGVGGVGGVLQAVCVGWMDGGWMAGWVVDSSSEFQHSSSIPCHIISGPLVIQQLQQLQQLQPLSVDADGGGGERAASEPRPNPWRRGPARASQGKPGPSHHSNEVMKSLAGAGAGPGPEISTGRDLQAVAVAN